jgi:hypothetical protein
MKESGGHFRYRPGSDMPELAAMPTTMARHARGITKTNVPSMANPTYPMAPKTAEGE